MTCYSNQWNYKIMCSFFISSYCVFSLILFFLTNQLVYSQNCDPILQVDKDMPYSYKSIDDRCEGFYVVPVSRTDRIDLVGLSQGPFSYALDNNEVIIISSAFKKTEVLNIRAQTIPLKMYYRMDASITLGDSLEWPAKDVIVPNFITSGKIGILGWTDFDKGIKYIPVIVKSKLKPVKTNLSVYAVYRPWVNIENMQYSIYDFKNNTSSGWKPAKKKNCRAGMPVTLILDINPGTYRITFAAKISGSEDEWIENQVLIDSQN